MVFFIDRMGDPVDLKVQSFSPAETEHFERLAMQTRLYPQLRYFIRDRYDTPVIRVVTCFGYERAYMLSEEIIIRSPDGKYTGPTHRLLSRYYKHL